VRTGHESECSIERASLEACLRGGERSLATSRWVDGQGDGALQERSRRGGSAASLRPAGRTLELGGDFLAGPRRGSGAMPGTPIRVRLGVRGLSEREMYAPPCLGSGCTVGSRPDERMGELDAPTHMEQPSIHRRGGCSQIDAERLRRTMEQQTVANGLRGRSEYEQLRVRGEYPKAPDIALLDFACYQLAAGQPESTG
jgi:hypothetical protein